VPLELPREIRRGGNVEAADELRCALATRQLQQSERVAARLGDDPVAHAVVERSRDGCGQQRARVLLAQPFERHLRKPLELLPPGAARE
jgi:hypothetical protein